MKKQTASETINECIRIRPVLKTFLDTFEPILTQRNKTAQKLVPQLRYAGFIIDEIPDSQPFLRNYSLNGMGEFIRASAAEVLPLLFKLEVISPFGEKLENLFLEQDFALLENLLTMKLNADLKEQLQTAGKFNLDADVLDFCLDFIGSAVLRALTIPLSNEDYSGWNKNICPICGSAPSIAWLARRPPAENNEFLRDGGGRKYLHCATCGADWHFTRGVCPGCGVHGQDAMQIIGEENRRHERIDWCKKCHTYLPQIDLREISYDPDLDAMALGLIHLDLAAAEKDLIPLKPSFWNMF